MGTETHTFVKTDLAEEVGVHEVITLDKDSHESKIQRDIVIDSLESSQPKPAEKKTSLVIPFMKKETKDTLHQECTEKTEKQSEQKENDDDGKCGASDVLHIRVHKARNLENKEMIGKSDPFIKIRL